MAWNGSRGRSKKRSRKIQAEDLPRLGASGHLELRARRVVQSLYAGGHETKAYGSSVEFAEHRAYQPGDDLRNVDWKAYGRSDQLVIRLFRDERHLSLAICCDCSASMDYGEPNKFVYGKIVAASVALLALDQRDRVDLFYGGKTLHRADQSFKTANDAQILCQNLEQINAVGSLDFVRLSADMCNYLRRSHIVLWVSDFYDDIENIQLGLKSLQQHGHEVVMMHVLDNSEVELPLAWEQSEFTDPEAVLKSISGNAKDLAKDYNNAVQAHIDQCRQLASGLGAEYLFMQTHQDPVDVLIPWLAKRNQSAGTMRKW